MKLHLPTMLRKALLACMTTVAGITFATGSAWADTYNLLADHDSWAFTSGRNNASWENDAIKAQNWFQSIATYHASSGQVYNVDTTTNTLTFTITYSYANGNGSSVGNAFQEFALVGNTQAIVLGTPKYQTTDGANDANQIGYATSTNTTADVYATKNEGWTGIDFATVTFTPFEGVTRQEGTYTLTGVVTKGETNYTLDVSLAYGEEAAVTYVDDLDLGTTFDINKVIMANDGPITTLTALTIEGSYADMPTVTLEGNGTNDNRLINTPLTQRIILNMDGQNNDYLYASGNGSVYTIANDVEIQSAIINNGNQNTTYKFTGTITGTGEFKRPNGANTHRQHYEFSGDMSAYSGNMSLLDNSGSLADGDTLLFNGNTSGTGTITVSGYNQVTVAGATMNNSAIDATYITISGASSFVGDVTVSTLLSIGADAAITLGADASLTLGEGALIDLANATYTTDEIGNRTYSFLATGSTGTHNLADLSAAMIKDAVEHYSYSFADGAIIMSLMSKDLFFANGPMTWNDEVDNTPFTNADGAATAFVTADNVTFNGTGTADVTLGETVTAREMTVADTATVNLSAGDYTLNATNLTVNGTLSVESGTVKPTAYSIGEAGELLVKSGAVLDFTAIDNQVRVGDGGVDEFSALNNDKIKTEAGGYVKIAFNHSGSVELKLQGDVTQAMNIEAVGAMVIHGNGASRSYTIGEGKVLLANGSSNSLQGLEAINKGIIAIAGGTVETNKLTLGHSSSQNNGEYWGKLAMTDGTLKIGNLTLRQNHNDVFSVTGGELEFTTSTALTRGSNTRATITIQGTGAGDSERVTLKSATSAWALDGAGLTTAPTIGNVTVEAAQDISLSNVALSGAIVKQGAGQLVLNTVNTDALSSMDIRQGYVTSATALTLSALTVAEGAGFAYDLGTTPALITAADYSGALTLNLSNVAVGDYTLFQGAAGLSADDINIEGVDGRLSVTKNVIDGLVSINIAVAGDALQLAWDTAGADNVWSNGGAMNWDSDSTPGADTSFADGDSVTFAGAGEEITISGDVAPAAVTVSGSGYAFAGSGKITGAASLTVENGGVLEIKSAQRYTGGTVVQAGGELILSTGGGSGALKGDIDVYGTLRLNANDATGWDNGEDVVGVINVYEGGLLSATTTANLTGSGIDINLTGGSVTGIAGSNIDLCYGGDVRRWSEINALAADGATTDNPTVSTISGVGLSLRQDATIITVEENAQLQISGAIHQKGDRPNGGSGQIPEGAVAGLNKAGAGELVLSGNNTYTQATTVAAGTLTLAEGGVLNSVVTVNEGATFRLESGATYGAASIGGAGSVVKTGSGIASLTAATTIASLDIQEGFVKTGADTATISTLTVANGVGFAYDLAAGQKKVVAESFDGSITLKLTSLANGTFELLQGAAGLDANDVNFEYSTGSRVQVTESVVNGLAKLEVSIDTTNLDNLVWNTAGVSDDWSAGGAANWTSGGATEQFINGDSVTFADTGETITIYGTVSPAAMKVTGTGYVFEGAGAFGGAGALTVTSGAEATISTINTFTGGTTIEEGATLTITKAKALGTYANMTNETVLGKVSGAGTLVINLDSEESEAVAKGSGDSANMGSFTGVVDVQRGQFYVGERNNDTSAGAETVFNASKVIVRADGALWTHFGGTGRTLTSAIDLMSGAELRNRDGNAVISGNIRFNIVDSAAATPSYDSEGVVLMTQYWNKTIELSGLLEGDGTVQMKTPEMGGQKGVVKLTGENNTFAGTYEVVQGGNNPFDLCLGSQTAAQYADIKLSATDVNVYLLLDSDATINGLYGVVDAENAVQAQGGNRTLTVSEGDFGGLVMDSGSNVLSLTKQGAGTLVLRGVNNYTGATTINGGTLEIAEAANMGTTAITVNNGGTLRVNAGTLSNSITGDGTLQKSGSGAATVSGLADTFAGTIDVQAGTLNVGVALQIGTGRTLKAGMNGATLSSALTLNAGTLALDYTGAAADATALSLNNGALTLAGGTTLNLSGLTLDTEAGQVVTLLSGVGSLLGADNAALSLGSDALAGSYFSSIVGLDSSVDTSTLGLQLVDGNLQLVVPEQSNYLVWGEGNGTWVTDGDFTAEGEDFTANNNSVDFAALSGESDTVTMEGELAVGKMVVNAGAGKTYIFEAGEGSGIASAESIRINGGTALFGAGTLDMTDGSIAVNNGATLSLANGAITNAGGVDLVLNNGSTLQWASGNTTDYSGDISLGSDADVTLDVNGNTVSKLSTVVRGAVAGTSIKLTDSSITTGEREITVDGGHIFGTADIVVDDTVQLNLRWTSGGRNGTYANNISGAGDLHVQNGTLIFTGNNTLTGELTIGGAKLKVDEDSLCGSSIHFTSAATGGAQFRFSNTGDTAYDFTRVISSDVTTGTLPAVYFDQGTVNLSSANTYTGMTHVGDGNNAVRLNLSGSLAGGVTVYGNDTLELTTTGAVNGTAGIINNGTVILHKDIATAVSGAGTVQVDGTGITWDSTNKTYTGTTALLANATVTTAGALTTGENSKITLADGSQLTITGGLDSWTTGHTASGAGTLILDVEGTATNALETLLTAGSNLSKLVLEDGTTLSEAMGTSGGANHVALFNSVQEIEVKAGSTLELSGDISNGRSATSTITLSGGALKLGTESTTWLSAGLNLQDDATITCGGNYVSLEGTNGSNATKIAGNGHALSLVSVYSDMQTIDMAVENVTSLTVSGNAEFKRVFSNVGALTVQSGTTKLVSGAFDATENKLGITGSINVAEGATLSLTPSGKRLNDIEDGSTSGEPTSIGAVLNMSAGSVLERPDGVLSLNGGLNLTGMVTMVTNWAKGMEIDSLVTGDADATMKLTRASGAHGVQDLLVVKSDNSVTAAGGFAGTWDVASNFRLRADAANAFADATVNLSHADATLQLNTGTVNMVALKGVAGSDVSLFTAANGSSTIVISNSATDGNDFAGAMADGVNVNLTSGYQKLSGAAQSGTHSYTATGGVLDMTGYTRATEATGTDTIQVLGGQVNGLNLAANMVLTGTKDVNAAFETITLGGNTVLGDGQMNFRVTNSTDATNTIPGLVGGLYKETNTLYQVGTGTDDCISLADGKKTYLNISLLEESSVLDPTPGSGTDEYRDHLLISGISNVALGDASAYFSMNLENIGSTSYSLHFVQNAADSSLVDLVLRAMGAAETLFWGAAEGGVWNTADGNTDWVKADLDGSSPVASTTPADFEQYDHVIFDDLAGAKEVTVTMGTDDEGGAIEIGSMTVQADTTNYTIIGDISSAVGNAGAMLNKTGAGTLTLTGANSYAGNTTITGGTVVAQNEAALSNTQVQIYGADTWLVLDYASTGDGVFDATVKLDGSGTNPGGSLRALQDAKANVVIAGDNAAKDLQVASGKTLELNVLSSVSTKLGGHFYINRDNMAGTLVMNLADNTTFTHTKNTEVYAGEYVLKGGSGTTLQDKVMLVAAGATTRVQGGMTLQVNTLSGIGGAYGDVVLEDASKLTISTTDAVTINNAISSEGATLTAQNATLTDLTLVGNADTTLAGGTWELQQGAISWEEGAEASLVLGENTTVKVGDDTLKNVKVNAAGATLATAKTTQDSVSNLSVETITVGNGGAVSGVNLTITGAGSSIAGTVEDITVNQAGTISAETPAVCLDTASVGSLLVNAGELQVNNGSTVKVNGTVTLDGATAVLDMGGQNNLKTADGAAIADVTIHAGSIDRGAGYTGLITIDDKGTAQEISLFRVSNNASILLKDVETETGVTTFTNLYGVTLADGSALTLTDNLEQGKGNVLFSFADDATGTVKMAEGATLALDVNNVLGDVLDAVEAGGISYTLADADISALGAPGKVVFDSVLNLYNIVASFNTDGTLVLSNTGLPLQEDSIYRSTEDNVDGIDWAGNGADVYASGDKYASVYIDKDTVIDLKDAAPDAAHAEDGLVLSNLIGRGNGATLTIEGNGDDIVTINNNLEATDLGSNVKSLSFNGDIKVSGTRLQLLNTVAAPGTPDVGKMDAESVYQVNGSLMADADSPVELTAGILKLNGRGADTSTLEGGLVVENEMAQLQVSGAAEIGGKLQVSDTLGGNNVMDDVLLISGGTLTLLDGSSVEAGFGIMAEEQGKETLRVAENATVSLGSSTAVQNAVLELQKGASMQVAADSLVSLRGLTGTGALVHTADEANPTAAPDIIITPTRNSVYSGDLSRYEGRISVIGAEETTAIQTFDKVTTAAAADTKLDMWLNSSAIIKVAEEKGNKTLNLRELYLLQDSDTTFEVNTDAMAAGGAPAVAVNSVAVLMPGAEMTLTSTGTAVLSDETELQLLTAADGVNLSDWNGADITLDITNNAFRKLSENATLSVVGNGVYVNMTASSTNRYADAVSAPNALAGAALLWPVAPDSLPADSALKAVDQVVADLLKAGDTEEAERVLAATAGASTAVLGSAFSADVERQLRAIRNRTTSMGVNQCEVNESMPYVNAWINAEGDHREMDADGLAAGYSLDSWGGTVGVDVDITNNLTMGLAVTAMYGDLETDAADKADGDFDTQYVSLFARVAYKAWVHTFVATVGRADVSLDRTVSYADGSYKTKGETDGMGYGLMYEVSRTFTLSEDGSTCWQPIVNLTWRHSSIDAYAESGCDAALGVAAQDMNVFTIGAGARLQTVIGENLYNRASIFEARALVKVDAGDREGEAAVALLEGASAANVTAAEVGAVGLEIGAGVTIPVGLESGALFIDGSAEFRSGYTNVNGTVGYRINF